MKITDFSIGNPTKVAVGVILVCLFGILAFMRVPVQLTPDVSKPTITVETDWLGASPQEVEKEIVDKQEEQLKSVEGVTDFRSESTDGKGTITLEFAVGTDMNEKLLKVANKLQQVDEYPIDADEPRITSVNTGDSPIAWFVLLPLTPTREEVQQYAEEHPSLQPVLDTVLQRSKLDLPLLVRLSKDHPELKPLVEYRTEPARLRNFAEDVLEARLERVPGVANSNVYGGQEQELQVIVDPDKLAARKITIPELRDRLVRLNKDVSAGDLWEANHRYVIRILGQFEDPQPVADAVVAIRDGAPVYVRDVAEVKLGFKKPSAIVRQRGVSAIALNVQKEDNANVLEVMEGVQAAVAELNRTELALRGLELSQVYDQTLYIKSSTKLVQNNIYVGGILAALVLLVFLRNVRSTLVVALSIPISIVGTFLIVSALGRSINVISLAGMAFAVGMVVDAAVVVLENIFTHFQRGRTPRQAASVGTGEVWGAILASTLTTLAVFIPVIFVQDQAGQLFRDIAIAISAAVAFSLIVSLTVVPTAASQFLIQKRRPTRFSEKNQPQSWLERDWLGLKWFANQIANFIDGVNVRLLSGRIGWFVVVCICLLFGVGCFCLVPYSVQYRESWPYQVPIPETFAALVALIAIAAFVPFAWMSRRLSVAIMIVVLSLGLSYRLMPGTEYLPEGNRNLVIAFMIPPPGYNFDQMQRIGDRVEENLREYWETDPESEFFDDPQNPPHIEHFFFVARGRTIFCGARTTDDDRVRDLIPVIQKAVSQEPGMIASIKQSSLFERALDGGRSIDIEITGDQLEKLLGLGGKIFGQVNQMYPFAETGTFVVPKPSLDLGSPEIHITRNAEKASQREVDTLALGYSINALVDGAYASDYYHNGEKIDLVIRGEDTYSERTQDIKQLQLATKSGELVSLGAVADVNMSNGPEQINRIDRERSITIQVKPGTGLALEDVMNRIENEVIAPIRESGELEGGRYRIELAGTADELKQMQAALGGSLLLAVLITYLLISALYESFLYPLVIMVAVPIAAVGGFIGLAILNLYVEAPLDTLTMLGFIILIGTVVNNPILIVDQALNNVRHAGMDHRNAVLESARSRIRPIFMTTTTTILGMAPLVLFRGPGSELYRGLGSVVLGGLLVSTMVALIVVPMLFTLTFELQAWVRRKPTKQEKAEEANQLLGPAGVHPIQSGRRTVAFVPTNGEPVESESPAVRAK